MKARRPVLTLLAVLAVGAAVFGVNTVVAGGGTEQAVTPAAQQAPAADPYAASDGYGAPAADPYGAAPEAVPEAAPEAAAPEAAPEQAPQAAAVTGAFAGRSAGDEVTLAVGMDGDKVVAYVCDGTKIESWFEGTSADGKLQLSGKDGELTADATDTAVLGTVSVGEKSWPFAAQLRKGVGAPTDRATLSELGSA